MFVKLEQELNAAINDPAYRHLLLVKKKRNKVISIKHVEYDKKLFVNIYQL